MIKILITFKNTMCNSKLLQLVVNRHFANRTWEDEFNQMKLKQLIEFFFIVIWESVSEAQTHKMSLSLQQMCPVTVSPFFDTSNK